MSDGLLIACWVVFMSVAAAGGICLAVTHDAQQSACRATCSPFAEVGCVPASSGLVAVCLDADGGFAAKAVAK